MYFKRDAGFMEFIPVLFYLALETIYQPLGLTNEVTTLDLGTGEVKYWVYQPDHFWINAIYYISISWLVGYLSYLVYQSRKVSLERVVIEQQNIFFLGIFIIFIITPVVFYVNIFIPSHVIRFIWITIVGRSFAIIGMTIFVLAYYRSAEKIDFFQPQPLEALFLLDSFTGKILYSKKFKIDTDWAMLEEVAMNVTVINKMLGDALGITSLMTSINFRDKELLIESITNSDIIGILVVRYETQIIHQSYTMLLRQISTLTEIIPAFVEPMVQEAFRI
jgi:hypothetical protein